MYCTYCGSKIDDEYSFCPTCGKRIIVQPKQDSSIDFFENEWYYSQLGKVYGPFTHEEIVEKITSGEITWEDRVKEADSKWISIENSSFAEFFTEEPTIEVSVSDIWVWCLAIIPIVITILLFKTNIISSIIGDTNVTVTDILRWGIPIGLNLLFIQLDDIKLRKSGILPSEWFYIGIFLVPLYLIVREGKTNWNFVPAVIWLFLFAVETLIL